MSSVNTAWKSESFSKVSCVWSAARSSSVAKLYLIRIINFILYVDQLYPLSLTSLCALRSALNKNMLLSALFSYALGRLHMH